MQVLNVSDSTVGMASASPATAVPPTAESQASPRSLSPGAFGNGVFGNGASGDGASDADSPGAVGAVSAAPTVRRIYADVDLGEYDEAYAGQSLRVLLNPTRAQRRDFLRAAVDPASGPWLAHMALILDCAAEDVGLMVDGMDIEILHWLFVPHVGDDGKVVLPEVYRVWDRYVDQRVKARAAR